MVAIATRTKSSQAQAASCIRKELKAAFPSVAFSVTSESFSMGDSVHINWTDGPTEKQVQAIAGKYQYGHFDGMVDLYEYSNRRQDIPQSKYVHENRHMSPETVQAIITYLNARYAGFALTYDPATRWVGNDPRIPNGDGWQSQEIHRLFGRTPLVCTCQATAQIGDSFCAECGTELAA